MSPGLGTDLHGQALKTGVKREVKGGGGAWTGSLGLADVNSYKQQRSSCRTQGTIFGML